MTTIEKQIQPEQIRPVPILLSFLIAGFVGLFSETALNMALGSLMTEFGVVSSTVQWLTTGYLLTLGILIPISAFLIQTFTTRQLFMASLFFSILGTIVAGAAPVFSVLLAGRVIQAIGTGILIPLMFNTVLLIFPINKRGTVMGVMGLVMMAAPATGPALAGLLIEKLSWHWIFWVTLPLLALALVAGLAYMQNVSERTMPKIDILSIILSTIGFGGIVYGFSVAGENGWGDTVVILSIGIGVLVLALFAIRQLKLETPMLDLRTLKHPMFTLGLLSVFATFMVILSTMILLPLYLQMGVGLAALTAGLVLLPGGIVNGIMSPITGRLFDKFGPKWLITPGYILMVVMLWNLSNVSTTTSTVTIILLHTFLFIGVSLVMMPSQTNGLNQLPRKLYPDGTALLNTLQQVSGAVGTAVAITIMSAGEKAYLETVSDPSTQLAMSEALTAGVRTAFNFGLTLAIIGLIMSFFIKSSRVD